MVAGLCALPWTARSQDIDAKESFESICQNFTHKTGSPWEWEELRYLSRSHHIVLIACFFVKDDENMASLMNSGSNVCWGILNERQKSVMVLDLEKEEIFKRKVVEKLEEKKSTDSLFIGHILHIHPNALVTVEVGSQSTRATHFGLLKDRSDIHSPEVTEIFDSVRNWNEKKQLTRDEKERLIPKLNIERPKVQVTADVKAAAPVETQHSLEDVRVLIVDDIGAKDYATLLKAAKAPEWMVACMTLENSYPAVLTKGWAGPNNEETKLVSNIKHLVSLSCKQEDDTAINQGVCVRESKSRSGLSGCALKSNFISKFVDAMPLLRDAFVIHSLQSIRSSSAHSPTHHEAMFLQRSQSCRG